MPSNLLVVQNTSAVSYTRRFTVCLTPLNFRYSRAYEIVEWIELNRILGAEKFTIYNYSSEYNVQKVLEHYSAKGLAEVLQWNIPLVVDTWPPTTKPEIHYFAQLAALQDCLYRNKGESEFIVNEDLDEFIIPRGANVSTWSEMISFLASTADAFVFQNTFYRKEWNDTTDVFTNKLTAMKYNLVTLLKTKRENKILRHGVRSKFIARTNTVEKIYVHDVPRARPYLVSQDVGLLHHYRNWLKYDEPEGMQDNVVVTKYAKQLTENVQNIWDNFQDLPIDLHTT